MDESQARPSGTPNIPAQNTQHAPPIAGPIIWIRRQWGLIIAVLVPIVTLATIVVPLVADASVRLTSAETLVVATADDPGVVQEVAVVQSSVTALGAEELVGASVVEQAPNDFWRVQATAPWGTFPLDPSPDAFFCTSDQIAWLEQWGRRDLADVWNGYLSLNNTAADGSAMSIRNIHSVGTFTQPAVVEVDVDCASSRGAFSEIIPLRQNLGTDTPAVFDIAYRDYPEGSPATLNIDPGEFLQIVVFFTQDPERTSDFAGSLIADVLVGDQTSQVVLVDGLTRQGAAGIRTTKLTIAGHTVACGADGMQNCSIPEFISQLESDPAYRS